jgi:ribose transport system permease protein
VLIVALFIFGSVRISGLATAYAINSMLILAALLGIAAIGQTLAMLLGGIDLSIPFVIGFADVVAAELTQRGWPFGLAILFVLAATYSSVSA